MQNINDKVVIITGGSSGIGEACALKLAREGAIVVLAARRKDRMEKIVADISANGGRAVYYVVDITDKTQIDRMVADVTATFGHIDVLMNNAGLMAMAPISALKVDEWERMVDINIKGVLYGTAAVWPIFEKQGHGHFINLSSVAGLKVPPMGGAVYAATKFAVKAFGEGLRSESAGKFRVTTLYPGYIESELMYGSTEPQTRRAMIDGYAQNAIPAENIANAVAFAISQPPETGINEITIRPTIQAF